MFVSSILGKVTHFATLNTEQKQAWEKLFFNGMAVSIKSQDPYNS